MISDLRKFSTPVCHRGANACIYRLKAVALVVNGLINLVIKSMFVSFLKDYIPT